jgi:thymidylate kinase
LRGDVVLYDRYYFDFINDSLRSNISLPKWLLRGGYRLLFQPTLNFFLYADAQTILSRKKELDEQTIKKLTHDYISLFNDLDKKRIGKYLAIENIHLDRTLHLVSKSIQAKLI